jgi:glutamate/tyrosine decarboxylase-like PLP-dependent enzyme
LIGGFNNFLFFAKKNIMEKLKFKVMHLGEWSVVNSNPDTKYYQIEGTESSGQVVKLWLPMAMVELLSKQEEVRKRKDSYRKTADYFKAERNELQKRNSEMAVTIESLRKHNQQLEESVGIMNYMAEDVNEEIQLILGFVAIVEALAFIGFYLLMQK